MRQIFIVYLFCLYASSNLLFANSLTEATIIPEQDKRETVMTSAKSYLGTRELTGNNDGVEVEAFLASVNLPKGSAWCAAFVNFIYELSQVKTPKSGWVPTWFPANKLVYKAGKVIKRIPIKGDVFGIYFASKKRLAHIGFIESWGEGKYATCIEGNTSGHAAVGSEADRNGDGVYRKYRLKAQIHSVANYIQD